MRPFGVRRRLTVGVPTLAAVLALGSYGPCPPRSEGTAAASQGARRPSERQVVAALRVQVLQRLPHDPRAFTEGLEMANGMLYEGTGGLARGESAVTAGPVGRPPVRRAELPPPVFGEGITVLGRTLWQLTWRDGIAVERDAHTLAERRRVTYTGEGWGLCHRRRDGRLVMSDGSDRLVFRDPSTFAVTGTVAVTEHGRPVTGLNELECVDGDTVYANIDRAGRLVRIDGATGAVTGSVDASQLLTPAESREAGDLNGVAAVPGTDQFLLTGKRWPKMFRVRFVDVGPRLGSPEGGPRLPRVDTRAGWARRGGGPTP
ncbi:glutaminyl-peptide cyclotransferase [Streptomyces sp. LX-29]|uniref:glutaminyl-peptide cyclotransferase n=1 Tax=Streptomyces sp. LX-29 TaxID=2900152 RepID=UPI00240E813E|nr:glutaminyl-peptide cyclotransferase [Streptomyces sp. LX-29]WFB06037.1 glutaminyl-peptide cyclotransferase [Streptomyces sp. LX-29]